MPLFTVLHHADNLLRQHKANPNVLSERSTNRPKEPSTAFLRRAGARSTSGTNLRRPSRQPLDPPQGAFAQSDYGFDQFLKEHSSPKDQRVTAGGRIVPMKELTPPPKMKLPINQQGTTSNVQSHDEPKIKPVEKVPSQVTDGGSNTSNYLNSPSLPAATLTDYAKLLGGNSNSGFQFQLPGVFANIPTGSITPAMILQPHITLNSGGQQLLQPEQRSMDCLPVFPNCAAYGIGADQVALLPNMNLGLNYPNATVPFMSSQTNSSASRSSSEFSTGSSNLNGLASAFGSISNGFDPFYQPVELPGQQVPPPQAPVLSQPVSFSDVPQEVSPWKALQEATKQYASLSTQLSRLDRYTAVHTWDLDPQQKRTAVEQRVNLVRELDATRTHKEQLESLYGQVKSSTSTKAQVPFTIQTSGSLANKSASLPIHAAGSTTHKIPTQPAAKSANVISTVQPVHQQSKLAQKRQNLEKEHSLNVCDKPKGMSTNREPPRENKLSRRGQSLSSNLNPDKRNIQSEALGNIDGWATTTQSAPPDIRRLYRKIEEAIRRGAPIDRLFQELATVTTSLPIRNREETPSALHSSSKRTDKESSEAKARAASGASRGHSEDVDESLRSAKLAARRQWASENQHRPPAELASFETDEDDEDEDGGSWSSYESMADSWDTVQEGE